MKTNKIMTRYSYTSVYTPRHTRVRSYLLWYDITKIVFSLHKLSQKHIECGGWLKWVVTVSTKFVPIPLICGADGIAIKFPITWNLNERRSPRTLTIDEWNRKTSPNRAIQPFTEKGEKNDGKIPKNVHFNGFAYQLEGQMGSVIQTNNK